MALTTKSTFSFAAFADDSDNESTCSCHTAEVAPDSLEYKILRSRFWVWPVDESIKGAWPCHCSDPAHAVEGDGQETFWECTHGKWAFIDSWDSLPPLAEDHCLNDCRGGSCKNHGLYQGLMLDLHLSSLVGIGWGDIIYQWEQEALARLSPHERMALAVRRESEDKAFKKSLADSEIRKAVDLQTFKKSSLQRMYDRRTGKPMPCKWADHPAENGWAAGCGKHHQGVCPYFHKDEPEWALIRGSVPSGFAVGAGTGGDRFAALKSSRGRW
jgi:hypothetical protein